MELGAFSLSLSVKDLGLSETFYNALGFKTMGGDASQNWLILQNGDHTIGLFQGMFEKNMMTFNPGWGQHAEKLDTFTDVRDLQKELRAKGIEPAEPADETTEGPASMVIIDPDGNPILIDQHR